MSVLRGKNRKMTFHGADQKGSHLVKGGVGGLGEQQVK